jgi:TRAP-type C4-dicarboxylate transport system substrate-binding protein
MISRNLLAGTSTLAAVGLAFLASACLALAQNSGDIKPVTVLKIRVVSSAPLGSVPFVSLTKVFMPEAERLLKGAGSAMTINWEVKKLPAVAPQTYGGREAFFDISGGIADVGLVDVASEAEDLPLLQAPWRVPFLGLDAPKLIRIFSHVIDQAPEIRQSFLARDQVLLALTASSEMVLVTKQSVPGLPGLKGKKIGLSAAAVGWLQNTGAIAVEAAPGSYHAGLKSGGLDGVILPAAWIGPLKLAEVAPYITRAGLAVMPAQALTFNKQRWDGLPVRVRDALYSAARAYQQEAANAQGSAASGMFAKLVAGGATLSVMSEADRKAWGAGLSALVPQWPAELKKSGKPAQAVMTYFLFEARKYTPHGRNNPQPVKEPPR